MPQTFIDKYLEHTKIYESPTSFWKWSAYAALSAVLRDNCYRRQGDSALFTNTYILFLAESSGHRKNRPIELCETLITKINNTKIISGRASVQAILDELAHSETDKNTGKILKAGAAIFFAPELSAGIVNDPEALKILTDIYDYKSNPYKSRLRTGPCFNLDRIVFSMLSASNEDMLRGFFDSVAIRGGLLARTFLIRPNEFRASNSLMRIDPDERKQSLLEVYKKLEEISRLRGEFKFTDDSIEEYENWYNSFRQSYREKKEVSGVIGRIHTGVLKLAMILAANDNDLMVTKFNIEAAISECLSLIPNYSVFTMSSGKSTISNAGALLMPEFLEAKDHTLERKLIIQKHYNDFDLEVLDKLIIALEQSGFVQQLQDRDHRVKYRLTSTALAYFGKTPISIGEGVSE